MPPRPPPASPPPATSFPFMSANFDFPHASTSPPPPPPPAASRSRATSASRDQLSQYLARRQDRAIPAGEDMPMPPRQPRMDPARRRQLRRPVSERDAAGSLLRRPPPPTTNTANRPRATPSERYLRRSHARLRDMPATLDSTTDMPDSLSDMPVVNPFTVSNSSTRPRSPASELDGQRRQTKRRKLEHDPSSAPAYDGFKYGYKGQVVAGRLRMDVLSCDGGEYDKYQSSGMYKIQNVLKNDKSVYCSESSRCNLLLRHIGETPFALEKVVIRAPDRGFTAPIQEGLIFVSMVPDCLISGTAGYKIEYESPSPPRSPAMSPTPSTQGDQPLSLREALEDPYVWQHSRQGVEEQIERLGLRSHRLQTESSVLRSGRDRRREDRPVAASQDDVFAENCEYPVGDSYAAPAAAGVSAPTPPPFTITTESDDESEENEEQPSAAIMADRLRRESRWRPDSDDEEDGVYRFAPPRRSYALDSLENYGERRWRSPRTDVIRATRLRGPSRIEPKDHASQSEGLIAPHARFFIAKHKNKITIKFHPAVSGKYILLKLWSPTHDGNIDIESVQFYGYSGPRFFPAVQPC